MSRSIVLAMTALACACGTAPDPASQPVGSAHEPITNGTPDDTDPAVVALVDASGTVLCSGTLISPHVVLTAAHCQIGPQSFRSFRAYFGSAPAGGGGTFIALSDARVHPQFVESTFTNDVAALTLSALAPAPPIAPLGPAPDATFTNATMRVVGFGTTSGTATDVGRKRTGTANVTAVTPTTFALVAAPSQPCSGDSGGPALLTVGGTEYLAGVTSHGDSACTSHDDDTRVDAFMTTFVQPYLDATAEGTTHAGEHCLYPGQCANADCVAADDEPSILYCAPPCGANGECPAKMTCATHDGKSQCRFPLPTPGAIGAACAQAADCVAGDCIETGICSHRCVSANDCPTGYACHNLSDIRFYCVPVPPATTVHGGACSAAPTDPPVRGWGFVLFAGLLVASRLRRTGNANGGD